MAYRCILLTALLALVLASPAAARMWVDKDGKSVEATFVRVEEGRAVVLSLAGRTVKVSFDNLSDADQKYVRQQLLSRGESHLLEDADPSAPASADPAPSSEPSESARRESNDAAEEEGRPSAGSAGRFVRDEVRIWTDNVGRQIEAKFIRIYLENVVLQQGRKMVQVPLENLSEFDLDYLREMMASRGQGYLIPATDVLRERARAREAARLRDPNQAGFGGTTLAEQMANDIMGVPRNRAGGGAGATGADPGLASDPYSSGSSTAGAGRPSGAGGAASGGYAPPPRAAGAGYGPRLPDRPTRPEPATDAAPYTDSAAGSYVGAGGSTSRGSGYNADAGFNDPYSGSGNPYVADDPYAKADPYAGGGAFDDPYSNNSSDSGSSSPFRRAGAGQSSSGERGFGNEPVAMNNRYSPPSGGFGSGRDNGADNPTGLDKVAQDKPLRAAAGASLQVTDTDSQSLMALIALIIVVGAVGLAVCFGYFT